MLAVYNASMFKIRSCLLTFVKVHVFIDILRLTTSIYSVNCATNIPFSDALLKFCIMLTRKSVKKLHSYGVLTFHFVLH